MPSAEDVAAQAEELHAIHRRVINVIGHELRTPVTTLHGLAGEACSATDLATVTDQIGPALLRGASRLTALLDDLLVAAGIQTAIPVGAPQAVDLPDLLTQVWAAHSDEPLDVQADAVTLHLSVAPLRRALDAVLGNAAAYSSGQPSAVVVRTEEGISIIVHSPGPGLHPEEVRLAVEPFFRGERAVTARPGLGLGLAIATSMVEHLGGALRFESSADGTATTITIPADCTLPADRSRER